MTYKVHAGYLVAALVAGLVLWLCAIAIGEEMIRRMVP